MGNLSTFIRQAFELTITLILIGIGATLLAIVRPAYDSVAKEAQYQTIRMDESRFSEFDSVRLNRAKIESAMRRYANEDNFYLYIDTGTRQFVANPSGFGNTCFNIDFGTGTLLTTMRSDCNVTLTNIRTEGGPFFINPQDRYTSVLVRDLTDRISGIMFKKV